MSEIRRLVHAAYEEEAAVHNSAGLYADERIRSFFAEVKSLVTECFQSLYDTVVRQYADPVERQRRLAKGLAFIASDENEMHSRDEVARALQEFPNISQEYQRAMVRFAQCMISKKQPNMKIECPPFDTFLFRLYKRVATSPEVKSGRYFQMSYLEQEIFLKDILRITMSSCMTIRSNTESLGYRGSVLPSDSVSNITPNLTRTMPSKPRHERSVLNNALSVATEEDEGQTLSEMSLREHKQRLQERDRGRERKREEPRAPAPFTTPSILRGRGGAPRSTVREVDVNLDDDRPVPHPFPNQAQFFDDTGDKTAAPSDFQFEDDSSRSSYE
jgi:hypothetical protein